MDNKCPQSQMVVHTSARFTSCRVVALSVVSFSGLTRGLGKKMAGYDNGWNVRQSVGLLMRRILAVYLYCMRDPHLRE